MVKVANLFSGVLQLWIVIQDNLEKISKSEDIPSNDIFILGKVIELI